MDADAGATTNRSAGPARLAGSLEAARRDQGQVAVGLTNTTHFVRSLTAGRVDVEAVALSQGRTQQLWQVDITDESGRLIAHGEVRLQNVAGR